jgi:CBS-domain-containing membrane protein
MQDLSLTTFRFPKETCVQQAQPKISTNVSLDSSALDVMTDLALVKAETIEPKTSLGAAEKLMINRGVRSLFVTADFPCVEGLVTAADLLGNRPMQVLNRSQVKHQDLCVEDVMTPLSDLDVLDYDELKDSCVDRVVATFEKLKCTHLLVVQRARAEGPARIRGVVSVTQLERQLAKSILTAHMVPEPVSYA